MCGVLVPFLLLTVPLLKRIHIWQLILRNMLHNLVHDIFFIIASTVQDNAVNWFDSVGQDQQNIFQALPEASAGEVNVENITAIKRDLEMKEAECAELIAKISTIENSRQTLQDNISDLNSNTQVLHQKIAELEAVLLAKNQQDPTVVDTAVKIEALENQVEDLQTKLTESEQLMQLAQISKSDLSQEISRLEHELASQKSDQAPTTVPPPITVQEPGTVIEAKTTESFFQQSTR